VGALPVWIHSKIKFKCKIIGESSNKFWVKNTFFCHFQPVSFFVINGYYFSRGISVPSRWEIADFRLLKSSNAIIFSPGNKIIF
jgi:hypothetical protein